ncbi:hypothetical protein GCM10007242_35410 [Pigmentiphaga litoralis]|uniref:DUF4255 domain-containing protein n=1 Tax=Pigmentiphaga litoralis TaxID=516702 RepID=UPI00167ABC89|nr:DUF4255 domain-containing protein [Pigmentiphaga litoralis]GGX24782.1 hypothetical protein GCM10007242_35410 [Pigmentiphaga litoralis]
MSSALAIAAVTAVLRDLLNDGLIRANLSGVLGSAATVSVLAPDRVVSGSASETSQLNLFLYAVTPNLGWRNDALPSRDVSGRTRLSNPPLALDLHYLVSAYSGGDLHADMLLGVAMQVLHETPVLTRERIRAALTPAGGGAATPALRALAASGLADQVELVKLTPEYLTGEDSSKIWSAIQSHFRPTAGYLASVVLIEASEPTRSPLPVLSRGTVDPVSGRDRGVVVTPTLAPPAPMLTLAVPPLRQPVARIGDVIELQGQRLEGSAREVVLSHDRHDIDQVVPAMAATPDAATHVRFVLDASLAEALPAGMYRVRVRVTPPAESRPRSTNDVALVLAPHIANLPMTVTRDAAGSAAFAIDFMPALRAGQQAVLVLGSAQYLPLESTLPTRTLRFLIPDAPVGNHLARLRIDGIDSPIVDLSADPPATPTFLDQRVAIQ